MKGTFKQRFKGALLLAVMGALAFAIFYGAYKGPWNEQLTGQMRQRERRWDDNAPSPVQSDKILLDLDKAVIAGDTRFIYHGLEDGKVHIVVFIQALDPQAGYHHRVPVGEAKKGFRLAGRTYRLRSCDRLSATLERTDSVISSISQP